MANLNRPFESRRSDVDRINSHGVKQTFLTVETPVHGPGETILQVPFASLFVVRPAFWYGMVLDDNQQVTAERFPTYSATVASWRRVQKEGENVGWFFKGATVLVVIKGETDMRCIFQTHFYGRALRNPTEGLSIDGAI